MIHLKRLMIFLVTIGSAISLTACLKIDDNQFDASNVETEKTVLEMEMVENYSDLEPIRNGLLFCVSEDVETLNADVFYQMNGESGVVEIKDRNADDILWSNTWNENVNINVFTISLNNLQKGKEYVVQFTGTNINHAVVKVTFDSDLVQEKERPSK